MKKLSMLFLTAIICTSAVIAQDTTPTMAHKPMGKHKMGHMNGMKEDCVMMKDSKMMVMKGGKTMAMDQDMTLTNGSVVSTDGMVKMNDGKSKQLKNGDCVYMSGKMMTGMKGMHKKGMKSKTAVKETMPM